MFHAEFWWVLAGIALMLCEFMIPGVILFFFGVGALITALATWIVPIPLDMQLALFLISSLVSLFGLRRFLKPVFVGRSSGTPDATAESSDLAGSQGIVTQEITPQKTGRISLNGASWKAISDEPITTGTPVTVTQQNNLTLRVKPNL